MCRNPSIGYNYLAFRAIVGLNHSSRAFRGTPRRISAGAVSGWTSTNPAPALEVESQRGLQSSHLRLRPIATRCFNWRPGYPTHRPRSYRRKIAFLIMAVIMNDIRANFEQRGRLYLRDSNKCAKVRGPSPLKWSKRHRASPDVDAVPPPKLVILREVGGLAIVAACYGRIDLRCFCCRPVNADLSGSNHDANRPGNFILRWSVRPARSAPPATPRLRKVCRRP